MISSRDLNGKSNVLIRNHNHFANTHRITSPNLPTNRKKSVEENIAKNFKQKPVSLMSRFESFGKISKLDQIIQQEMGIRSNASSPKSPMSNKTLKKIISSNQNSNKNLIKAQKILNINENSEEKLNTENNEILLQKYYNKANESYKVLV